MPRSSFIRKNQHILKHRPLVVGTLTGGCSIQSQLSKSKGPFVDVIEIRLDTFKAASRSLSFSKELTSKIRKKTKKQILLTFRASSESNQKKSTSVPDSFRAHVIKNCLGNVNAVDLEIRKPNFVKKLMPICRQKKVAVIHSYHDFSGKGNWRKIESLAKKSNRMKSDFFKVAVTLKRKDDLNKFISSGMNLSHPSKILIGMGPYGKVTRTLGFSFGSLLTYGHLGQAAAPGQQSAPQLGKKVKAIYGR